MTKPDKSKTMDVAEKLMLDLMEKHQGVRILAARAIPKRRKRRPEVLRTIVGHFMKHSSVQ